MFTGCGLAASPHRASIADIQAGSLTTSLVQNPHRALPKWQHSQRIRALRMRAVPTETQQGLLCIDGISKPIDCLRKARATAQDMKTMSATLKQQGACIQEQQDIELYKLSILPALQLIAQRHPEASWKQAAAAAAHMIEREADILKAEWQQSQTPAAAAAAAAVAATVRSSISQHNASPSHEAQQLQDWLHELCGMDAAATAAAVDIVHDPGLAPVLLINAELAQQHPLWSADYKAWQQQQQPEAQGEQQQQQQQSPNQLLLLLPAITDVDISDSVAIPVVSYYAAAAAAPQQGQHVTTVTNVTVVTTPPAGHMPWPLTGAATAALLCSPPGVLRNDVLQSVYELGLVGRVKALAAAVDLKQLLLQERHSTEESLKLMQQQQSANANVTDAAAAATMAAYTSSNSSSSSSLSGSAVRHAAVAAAFLQDLAAYSKHAAAAELQHWLDICTKHANLTTPTLTTSSSNSSTSQQQQQQPGWQLPDQLINLQPYQIDGLRQMVAIIATTQSSSTVTQQQQQRSKAAAPAPAASAAVDSWLHDYTHTKSLLQGACELLGGWLNLTMKCSEAPLGTSWCEEAYVITVENNTLKQQQQQRWRQRQPAAKDTTYGSNGGSSSSSSSGPQFLGRIVVLFDSSYTGLPYTANVSQGGYYKKVPPPHKAAAAAAAQPTAAAAAAPTDQQLISDHTLSEHGVAFQPNTVAIIFPASFGSSSSMRTGSSSSSTTTAAAASSKLSTVLHELGHALHFVLSATAAGAGAGCCCCWSGADVCEVAAYLTERMARDARGIKVLLRHHVSQRPPSAALTRQLQDYITISSRGAWQWQQHLMAALTDARLAAAAAGMDAGSSSSSGGGSSCWEVLTDVIQEFSPLQDKGLSATLLSYLPAASVMPGSSCSYIFAELVAAAVWDKYLAVDPLDPGAAAAVRRLLFEASATQPTADVVEQLLGPGSMQQLAVQCTASSSSSGGGDCVFEVTGHVPCLEHVAFQDIDLWG